MSVFGCLVPIVLRREQNGCHFTDDTFEWIFLIRNCFIFIKILKNVVPMGQISRQWPRLWFGTEQVHYNDVIMNTMASQITSLMIVFSNVYSDEDQRKNQRSASLAYVRGIDRSTVNSPHKGPVTREMFPFEDIIMWLGNHDPVHISQVPLCMYRGSI